MYDMHYNMQKNDKLIAHAFKSGDYTLYRGRLFRITPWANNKYGREIPQRIDKQTGYVVVSMVWNKKRSTPVRFHRVIAIYYYGLEKVQGKHVAHKNGIKIDNRLSNIIPLSQSEHFQMDKINHGSHLKYKSQCKNCGAEGGKPGPRRRNGNQFGILGQICVPCYNKFHFLKFPERYNRNGTTS